MAYNTFIENAYFILAQLWELWKNPKYNHSDSAALIIFHTWDSLGDLDIGPLQPVHFNFNTYLATKERQQNGPDKRGRHLSELALIGVMGPQHSSAKKVPLNFATLFSCLDVPV